MIRTQEPISELLIIDALLIDNLVSNSGTECGDVVDLNISVPVGNDIIPFIAAPVVAISELSVSLSPDATKLVNQESVMNTCDVDTSITPFPTTIITNNTCDLSTDHNHSCMKVQHPTMVVPEQQAYSASFSALESIKEINELSTTAPLYGDILLSTRPLLDIRITKNNVESGNDEGAGKSMLFNNPPSVTTAYSDTNERLNQFIIASDDATLNSFPARQDLNVGGHHAGGQLTLTGPGQLLLAASPKMTERSEYEFGRAHQHLTGLISAAAAAAANNGNNNNNAVNTLLVNTGSGNDAVGSVSLQKQGLMMDAGGRTALPHIQLAQLQSQSNRQLSPTPAFSYQPIGGEFDRPAGITTYINSQVLTPNTDMQHSHQHQSMMNPVRKQNNQTSSYMDFTVNDQFTNKNPTYLSSGPPLLLNRPKGPSGDIRQQVISPVGLVADMGASKGTSSLLVHGQQTSAAHGTQMGQQQSGGIVPSITRVSSGNFSSSSSSSNLASHASVNPSPHSQGNCMLLML